MTTDAQRAAHLSRTAADGLGQAAISLRAAMEQIEAVDQNLDRMGRAAGELNQQALGLAFADEQDDRWNRLNAAREAATALDDQLGSTQRVLAGQPLASDGVDRSAEDHLLRGAGGIEAAERALGELQWVEGHDAGATRALAERASVLRSAVDGGREAIGGADRRMQSARDSLAVLTRGDYLRSDQEPRYLAAQVAAVGTEAGQDIARAHGEVTRTDGRLDTARPAANSAAYDSADLAARAGLNPTPRSQQRPVASTGDQDLRQRVEGSQRRDPQNRGRD
jgi:hypothetical protein